MDEWGTKVVDEEEAYRDIHKLHERKAPAGHSDLVLDQHDPLHPSRAFLSESRRVLHGLRDSLRARQRIKTPKQEYRDLRVPNVARPVVRVLRATPLVARTCALRIVDLDPSSTMRRTGLEGLVKRRRRRRAMRGGRRDLNERVQRVDERARVFDACELGEAEALGSTLFTEGEENRQCGWFMEYEGASKCLLIYLGLW